MTHYKSRDEMAQEYGLHRTTFNRKLKDAGIVLPSGLISPKHQEIIYNSLGMPDNLPLKVKNR